MEFLGPEDRQFLQEAFGRLAEDVHLKVETRPRSRILSPGDELSPDDAADETIAAELVGLLTEVATTSPRIKVTVDEVTGPDLPAITFSSTKSKGRLRFLGLPAGHETSTLIAAILDLGTEGPLIPPDVISRLEKLERDVHVQVFVTPDCPHCPQMARMALQLAMVSDKIKSDVIEVQEFPELGEKYEIRGVPLTVVNDTETLMGVVNPLELVKLIEKQGLPERRIITL